MRAQHLFAAASLLALSSAPALAQTATQVQEVIVTATKRSENIQTVPAAITALSAQNLAKTGATKLVDYVAQIPGLSITTIAPGSMQIAIRGITSGENEASPTTSIYIDDAPFGSVNAYAAGSDLTPDLDPAELSQIEVLKGPQGTLYGASAVGGVVKFDTIPVNLEHYSGEVTAGGEVTSEGTAGYTFRGMADLPIISDVLGVRVSGFTREDPGYIKNLVDNRYQNDSKVAGGRLEVLWKPTSHISVDLWALIHNIDNKGFSAEDVNYQTLQPLYAPLTMKAYVEQPSRFQFEVYNATVKGQWGTLNLTSSTTYQDIRGIAYGDATQSSGGIEDLELFTLGGVIANPADTALQNSLASKVRRFSQEFRVSDSFFNGRVDAQAGVFFTHENDLLTIPGYYLYNLTTGAPITPNYFFGVSPILSAEITSRYTEYSGYADLDFHITDKFDIMGGVRESHNNQNFFEYYGGTYIALANYLSTGVPTPVLTYGSSSTGRDFNYLVTPRYKIDDNNMVYARFADGYRPGGANAFPTNLGEPATFQPDTVTSYEVGYKGQWLDRTLTVDLALFWNQWDNIQLQIGVDGFQGFVNGGTARTRGAELSTSWRPVQGLTFGLNGAYTEANLTADAPAAGGLNGDELPFVPRWTGSLTADYNWPIMDGWTGDVGGSVNYVGNRISGFVGSPANTGYGVPVPSYTTLNLNAGVTHGRVTLQAYIRNLGNSRGIVYAGVLAAPILTDYNTATIIPPRTFGGQVTVAF